MSVPRTFALLTWLSLAALLAWCSFATVAWRSLTAPAAPAPIASSLASRPRCAAPSISPGRRQNSPSSRRSTGSGPASRSSYTDSAGTTRIYVSVFVRQANDFPQVDAFLAFVRARVQSEMEEGMADVRWKTTP